MAGVRELVPAQPTTYLDSRGRVCTKCGTYKEWAYFAQLRSGPLSHNPACKSCNYARPRGPDSNREAALKKAYGISVKDYESMWILQAGVCAICKEPETRVNNNSGEIQRLTVDHEHSSGKVRGLLCSQCNLMLGNSRDTPEYLRAGADYLAR